MFWLWKLYHCKIEELSELTGPFRRWGFVFITKIFYCITTDVIQWTLLHRQVHMIWLSRIHHFISYLCYHVSSAVIIFILHTNRAQVQCSNIQHHAQNVTCTFTFGKPYRAQKLRKLGQNVYKRVSNQQSLRHTYCKKLNVTFCQAHCWSSSSSWASLHSLLMVYRILFLYQYQSVHEVHMHNSSLFNEQRNNSMQ